MCGRYTITRQQGLIEDLEAVMDPNVTQNPWWKPRFNVAPTQDAPVVTLRDGVRTLEMMRWGLVPFWAGRDGSRPPLMINARVETLRQKPMFRDALTRGRRCLVPADGFFEWKKGPKSKSPKQPMWIHPDDGHLFAFAGLWARNKSEAGEVHSFTIVTGPPNDLVAPIHDRMPVVLSRDAWPSWLDPALPSDEALALLGVPPIASPGFAGARSTAAGGAESIASPGFAGARSTAAGGAESIEHWVAEPVSPWVNVADHDDEQCVVPITEPVPAPPKQGSLF